MPENTIATKTFTYKIPNERYGQDDSDGNTVSMTYEGVDKVYLFVDADGDHTGKINTAMTELMEADDCADVPLPEGTVRVEVTLADDPLIMAIVRPAASTLTISDQTEVTETYSHASLGDYPTTKYNSKPDVGETFVYEKDLEYDIDAGEWKTVAYQQPSMTWDDVIINRDTMLEGSDGKISPDMPDAVKAPWVTYRAMLRDLPTSYKKGESDEVPAWKVRYPLAPDTKPE